jgi:hypothetical protein
MKIRPVGAELLQADGQVRWSRLAILQLFLYTEKIALCPAIQNKRINMLQGHIAQHMNVKPGGT